MSAVVIRGDARQLPLPDDSADLIVTSPPYFGLRSYTDGGAHYAAQIGSEDTPAAYVAALLDCTREWMRVLKPSGSLWVNLGDKYSGYTNGAGNGRSLGRDRHDTAHVPDGPVSAPAVYGISNKSLMGLPWRYALGAIDDLGLILRAEVIWAKPNGLPESVTDRVRRSHEQWFHLTMQPRYYSAVDEIREEYAPGTAVRYAGGYQRTTSSSSGQTANGVLRCDNGGPASVNPLGKLPGSVWTIPTQPLTVPPGLGVDHFAAFPMEWPRRIIQGWSPAAICAVCGEGRRPVTDAVALNLNRPQARRAQQLADQSGLTEQHFAALLSVGVSDTGRGAATQSGTGKNTPEVYALAAEARAALGGYAREYLLRRPTRFAYVCACPQPDAPTRPSCVVDPFGGTGTTALIASVLGRTGISVDRSADYCRLAAWRTTDPGQRAAAMQVPKPPAQLPGQGELEMTS